MVQFCPPPDVPDAATIFRFEISGVPEITLQFGGAHIAQGELTPFEADIFCACIIPVKIKQRQNVINHFLFIILVLFVEDFRLVFHDSKIAEHLLTLIIFTNIHPKI